MSKQRDHYWRIVHQRYRREWNGAETPMTSPVTLTFPDKQLYQETNREGEPADLGFCMVVRKGAIGILDALLASMRQESKKGTTKGRKAA